MWCDATVITGGVDVHQHLWPPELVAALRARSAPPLLDGWTLHVEGEPAFAVDPDDHDVERRAGLARSEELSSVLVSLSSPLGIEDLPPSDAVPLLEAYHDGSLALPAPFRVWAAAGLREIDPAGLDAVLARGCVGLQLPATALADAEDYGRLDPLLDVLEATDKPLFIHPGPAAALRGPMPAWWPPLVPYVQQMHAAWFAFHAFGRFAHPHLRVCFAMLAGLAPLHGERFVARAAAEPPMDADVFLETSSYGPDAVGAVAGALGTGAVVAGSDMPYARLTDMGWPEQSTQALRVANAARLLGG